MKTQPARKPRPGHTSRAATTVSPARLAAFDILRRVENEGAFASTLLATLDDAMRIDDRALCQELVLGVLRRRLWLDRVIEYFSGRSIESLDMPVLLALRLGLYQLRCLSRVPASAAVNESVNLMHVARVRSAASFVNAVLRRATREPDYDPAANIGDPIQRIVIETSHPVWLIERWARLLGIAETESFARANNERSPVAFRLTARAVKSERVLVELREAGAALEPSQLVPEAWRIKGAGEVLQKLSGQGLIYVQDEASQLVAHALGAQAGERVIDVCAAPGSKTTHIAALTPQLMIVAGDLHQHRLQTLRRLASSQGATAIHLVTQDAAHGLPFADGSFDRVLVDAPCTGTGTLRHNPEIRWRITAEDIIELAARQKLILFNAARLVRRGGCLVYSSCSVEPEENESVVQAFLEENSGFEPLRLQWRKPDYAADLNAPLPTSAGAVRTWPHKHDVDGFFIAAFTKV
ncbi:MAG: 16S rRNA (cytosine(967)-C(5))-methyltransferase RsmB [Pyrinomonadaceae bacterium]